MAGGKYTETHQIYIEAFDSAGNSTKTDPVTILVTHKEKKATAAPLTWAAPMALTAAATGPAPMKSVRLSLPMPWRSVDASLDLADNKRPRGRT